MSFVLHSKAMAVLLMEVRISASRISPQGTSSLVQSIRVASRRFNHFLCHPESIVSATSSSSPRRFRYFTIRPAPVAGGSVYLGLTHHAGAEKTACSRRR
jgi:hypothetical protein